MFLWLKYTLYHYNSSERLSIENSYVHRKLDVYTYFHITGYLHSKHI